MNWFAGILEHYGDNAVVHTNGQEHHIKAFVNPVIGERYMKKWKSMTGLGEVDQSTYYYFGPPDCKIVDCENSYVVCNGRSYQFVRAEEYRVEGEASHWEAMLRIREVVYDGGA